MAESIKRIQQNKNKSRKPKNELIKISLRSYLKGRNFSTLDKLRKPEKLTQTSVEMAENIVIDGEISSQNSISYSNVFCLNNNPNQVDLQFTKFVTFVQSQKIKVKSELQQVLPPLLCHLYIEMLKGRDWRPALDFLKKHANIVAPVESACRSPGFKLNGNINNSPLFNDDKSLQHNGLSPIIFTSDQLTTENALMLSMPENVFDSVMNENNLKESFKQLIQILSTVSKIQEIDQHPIVTSFRSCKYQIKLSEISSKVLKSFLSNQGHLIIIQIIHKWFHIEIDELMKLASEEDNEEEEDYMMLGDSYDDFDSLIQLTNNDNLNDLASLDYNLADTKLINSNDIVNIENIMKMEMQKSPITNSIKTKVNHRLACSDITSGESLISKDTKNVNLLYSYIDNVDKSNARDELVEAYSNIASSTVIRLVNIEAEHSRLCSASIDQNECHIVGGFDNSNIQLWALKKSSYYGRKPFSCINNRLCQWNIENCEQFDIECTSSEDSSSSSDSDDDNVLIKNRFRSKSAKKVKWKKFMEARCTLNKMNSNGCITMRGHSNSVTDVLLSQYNPLLYSVSRDCTMRAWRASDYVCASVYRGHNYPIWCIAESSNGLYLATGAKDKTARLWSTDRHFPLFSYVGHTQDVDAIAFHPNGSYLATGSSDLSLRLWCVTSGKLFRVFTDCKLPIQTIAFSPNGKYLAASGEEYKIRIFDLAAGSQLHELRGLTAPATHISWNHDSTTFACCSADGSFKIWNTLEVDSEGSIKSRTPSTSTSSLSSQALNSSLLYSSTTNCKRLIKLQYNIDNSISLIGNS